MKLININLRRSFSISPASLSPKIAPPPIPSSANVHFHQLRCTIYDSDGNVVKFNSLINKDVLCAKYNLFSRDLRKLNTVSDYLGQLVIDHDRQDQLDMRAAPKDEAGEYEVDPDHSGVDILINAMKKRHMRKQLRKKKNVKKIGNPEEDGNALVPSFLNNNSLALAKVDVKNEIQTLAKKWISDGDERKTSKKEIERPKREHLDEEIKEHQKEARELLSSIKDSFITGGILDSNTSATIPSMLIRDDKIIVTMLEFRCLIEKDSVVVFDSHYFREIRKYTSLLEKMLRTEDYIISRDDSTSTNHIGSLSLTRDEIKRNLDKLNYLYSLHESFRNEMSIKLKDESVFSSYKTPYEFRALEAVLNMVIKALNGELQYHVTRANDVLKALEYSIDKENLKDLLLVDKRFNKFHQKANLCSKLLEEILEEEGSIKDMHLHVPVDQRQLLTETQTLELEMLMENYHTQIDEIVQLCEKNVNSIKTTEEIINIVLDSNRNQLLLLGLRFSSVLLAIGASIFISSLYGMNLENFIENSDTGFPGIVMLSAFSILLVLSLILKKVEKVEKMNLTKLMKPTNVSKAEK
ncbi:Mitochondrial inner membrane magnesium transporter LPE10 [Hanseniaspora opuntiae]|uniref:Magnesium transporter n=1 Tax=Hanseniaspora opuntiae TaxID=211096 RepID=A0A1E5RSW9_9ASCO|nr:Mitochondrial inner membrane magnesium transporter LPE10 [Hanseniaspora opuntiae]